MNILLTVVSAIAAYLLGNLQPGVWFSRAYGNLDIRKTGSGNMGTTNVLRTLGWVPSMLTLVCDVLKGVLGALLGLWLAGETGMLVAAFCAVLGHDFPVLHGFKGGKGIATSLGVTFVVCTPVAPLLVLIVAIALALTRLMSLGSLIASLAYPFLMLWLCPRGEIRVQYMVFAAAMALLSFFCHRSNLRRLFSGSESRLDFQRIARLTGKYRKLKNREKE